jgi:hypothetical protein
LEEEEEEGQTATTVMTAAAVAAEPEAAVQDRALLGKVIAEARPTEARAPLAAAAVAAQARRVPVEATEQKEAPGALV